MVSALEILNEVTKKLGAEWNDVQPDTSSVVGYYEGDEFADLTLALLLKYYSIQEVMGEMISINDTFGWVPVQRIIQHFNTNRENSVLEVFEHGFSLCIIHGFIKVHFYNGSRYFHITEKCKKLEFYLV